MERLFTSLVLNMRVDITRASIALGGRPPRSRSAVEKCRFQLLRVDGSLE